MAMEKEVDWFISDLKAALEPAAFQAVADAIARLVRSRPPGPDQEEAWSWPKGEDVG